MSIRRRVAPGKKKKGAFEIEVFEEKKFAKVVDNDLNAEAKVRLKYSDTTEEELNVVSHDLVSGRVETVEEASKELSGTYKTHQKLNEQSVLT